jgi:uncharacterized protein (DUF39 family)
MGKVQVFTANTMGECARQLSHWQSGKEVDIKQIATTQVSPRPGVMSSSLTILYETVE